MRCLGQFSRFLLSIFLRLDRVADTVGPGERISRYIFEKRHVKGGKVSFGAFLPSRAKELSVYRTDRCSERRIWLLGELFVERIRKGKVKILARGDVSAVIVFEQGLKIVASKQPHPRHANVLGWPDDKPQQRMKAVVLAQKSHLFVRP